MCFLGKFPKFWKYACVKYLTNIISVFTNTYQYKKNDSPPPHTPPHFKIHLPAVSLKSFSYGKYIQLLCTCFEKCTEDLHLPASCKTVDVMFWFCKSNKLWIAVCQGNSSPWVNWIIRENWTYIVTSVKESRPAESGFLSLNSVQDTRNWKLKFVLKLLCNDLVAFRM